MHLGTDSYTVHHPPPFLFFPYSGTSQLVSCARMCVRVLAPQGNNKKSLLAIDNLGSEAKVQDTR